MEQAGVKRFVYLSSIGAGESRKYMPQPIRFLIADLTLRIPLADHTTNENRIKRSRLEWTIVRPGGLTDGDKTDRMRHGLSHNDSKSKGLVSCFLI